MARDEHQHSSSQTKATGDGPRADIESKIADGGGGIPDPQGSPGTPRARRSTAAELSIDGSWLLITRMFERAAAAASALAVALGCGSVGPGSRSRGRMADSGTVLVEILM